MVITSLANLTDPGDPQGEQLSLAISRNGTVASSGLTASLWDAGVRTGIGAPGPASGVNDLGWVVGNQLPTTPYPLPYLWQDGMATLLPQLASAQAINDAGQIAGTVIYSGSGSTALEEAALYQSGQVTLLGFLAPSVAGAQSSVQAINDQGEVVGSSTLTANTSHAFLWKGGVMSDLGVMAAGDSSFAYALNDTGQAVGAEIAPGSNYYTAVLFQNGTVTALPQLGDDDYSAAYGINAAGLIVGAGRARSATQGLTEAILWDHGQAIGLNDLLPANSGWTLFTANGISDSGQIVGAGSFDGVHTSYELTLGSPGSVQIGVAALTASLLDPKAVIFAVPVLDSAADVTVKLESLETLAQAGKLASIAFTDSGAPTVTISTAQMGSDEAALAKFSGNYAVASPGGDIFGFSGAAGQYNLTVLGDGGGLMVSGNALLAEVKGTAELRFSDQTEWVAQTPAAGSVTSGNIVELYGAVFGRRPDIGGLAFYQDYLQNHPATPFLQVAEWFLSSSEYSAAHSYAPTPAGDILFIQDAFQTLLHRTPSVGEIDFYLTNVMNKALANLTPGTQGYASADFQAHAQMLVYFSASPEFLADVQVTAQNPASAQHWLVLA